MRPLDCVLVKLAQAPRSSEKLFVHNAKCYPRRLIQRTRLAAVRRIVVELQIPEPVLTHHPWEISLSLLVSPPQTSCELSPLPDRCVRMLEVLLG